MRPRHGCGPTPIPPPRLRPQALPLRSLPPHCSFTFLAPSPCPPLPLPAPSLPASATPRGPRPTPSRRAKPTPPSDFHAPASEFVEYVPPPAPPPASSPPAPRQDPLPSPGVCRCPAAMRAPDTARQRSGGPISAARPSCAEFLMLGICRGRKGPNYLMFGVSNVRHPDVVLMLLRWKCW